MELDTVHMRVERRLWKWAEELRGGGEWLGFSGENWLHKALGRSVAVRHVGVSEDTMVIEAIILEIQRENSDVAQVLKAYYMRREVGIDGRRKAVEKAIGREISRYKFWQMFHDGFDRVQIYLQFLEKTS
jgi:hypothetical protein